MQLSGLLTERRNGGQDSNRRSSDSESSWVNSCGIVEHPARSIERDSEGENPLPAPPRLAPKKQAERAGFEPAVRFDPHTAFPVPHNRPLCHLSLKTKSEIRISKSETNPKFKTGNPFFLREILAGFICLGKLLFFLLNWQRHCWKARPEPWITGDGRWRIKD